MIPKSSAPLSKDGVENPRCREAPKHRYVCGVVGGLVFVCW